MSRSASRKNKLILELAMALLEEENMGNRKRLWVRKWIGRRATHGASMCLLKEVAIEDPKEYLAAMRMSQNSFTYLLLKVEHQIQRQDTRLRKAIPAKIKLEAVLLLFIYSKQSQICFCFITRSHDRV